MEYFFATNCGGKSNRPLVSGAAMFDKTKQKLDLHFISFKYRRSYMKNLLGSDGAMKEEDLFGAKQ